MKQLKVTVNGKVYDVCVEEVGEVASAPVAAVAPVTVAAPAAPAADGWKCACGSVNTGKFCSECGAKKPAGVPQYKCDKCGWEPEKGVAPPRFCPECGDAFDSGDIV